MARVEISTRATLLGSDSRKFGLLKLNKSLREVARKYG